MKYKPYKTSFISGKFNVLHAGHIMLFKFAKSVSERLIVGVQKEALENNSKLVQLTERMFAVSTNKFVDQVIEISDDVNKTLNYVKPDVIIKGSEHESSDNIERLYAEKASVPLIFSAGSAITNDDLGRQYRADTPKFSSNWQIPKEYINRHSLKYENLQKLLLGDRPTRILIIGDTIIDKYIDCKPLGMSQEEPLVVFSPTSSETFSGGASIVAGHAKSLLASVKFFTLLGSDHDGENVREGLKRQGIEVFSYTEVNRITSIKSRFKVDGRSVFRLNDLVESNCSEEIQNLIFLDFVEQSCDVDLIVFSDFNYGALPAPLIKRLIKHAELKNIPYVADSQSSSQHGDITRYKNAKLVTPTEYEARVSLNNKEDGLVQLAEKIRLQTNSDHVFLKLGKAGVIIHNSDESNYSDGFVTDELPALYKRPIDTAGAGDSLVITAAITLTRGASIWQAALLGSIAAGIQVSRDGNTPVTVDEISDVLQLFFR